MNTTITSLTAKVRKAIDDIAPEALDDFSTDANEEMAQAIVHAATSLLQTLPIEMLEVSTENYTNVVDGAVALPSGFLRFVAYKAADWSGSVKTLVEPGSDEEKMQHNPWSRGSNSKPKAMLEDAAVGPGKYLSIWPTCANGKLYYIAQATINDSTLTCGLKSECEKNLINLAASMYLEGKKEHDAAANFLELSKL